MKFETPNYSLRMSDLTASCIRPQIDNIEERIAKVALHTIGSHAVRPASPRLSHSCLPPLAVQYNKRYARMVELVNQSPYIDVPQLNPRVRPVCDSLQFNLVGMTPKQVGGCTLSLAPFQLHGSIEMHFKVHTSQLMVAPSHLVVAARWPASSPTASDVACPSASSARKTTRATSAIGSIRPHVRTRSCQARHN